MIWDQADANPLHRRIPGEIISRRVRVEKKPVQEKEPEEVVVDLRATSALKPEARLKWLVKACKMVSDNLATSTDLYDVVVNRKYVSGMPERVVRKVAAVMEENMDLFSDKQQRYLTSNDCPIMSRLVVREAFEPVDYAPDPEDAADAALRIAEEKPPPPPAEKPPPVPRTSSGSTPLPLEVQRPIVSSSSRRDRDRERERDRDREKTLAASDAGNWQSVKDEWAIRRQEAESKEHARREADRKKEKDRQLKSKEEDLARSLEQAEAEKRRKLEEEADALFSSAVSGASSMALTTISSSDKERRRSPSLSRSRSISSRTARRLARQNKSERLKNRESRGAWKKDAVRSGGGGVSGSRAIFMNKDFVEDLPHMPRSSMQGTKGVGGLARESSPEARRRSRSRERRRRKE